MGKTMKTVPVFIEDEVYKGGWFIVYVREEGMNFEVFRCDTEDEADAYMMEYERSGTFTIPMLFHLTKEITPVLMLKVQATRGIRKQWTYAEIE